MAKGKGGFIGQDGLNAPDSPTGVSGTEGDSSAEVSFTAPSDVGGSAITGYRVQSNNGIGASGSSSPITVTGLTNGTSYTFNVWAINAFGYSAPSDASGSVTPAEPDYGMFMRFTNGSAADEVKVVNIKTLGNTTDFGTLSVSFNSRATASSSTRGLIAGGQNSGGTPQNNIDYITIGSTGSGTDFGDISQTRTAPTGLSNSTRAVFSAGEILSGTFQAVDTMDYVAIATTGNASDFGDLGTSVYHSMSTQSSTRGLIQGGREGGALYDFIKRITISTTGNAAGFGNLSQGNAYGAAVSSGTRAVFAFGYQSGFSNSNIMEYVTIATVGSGVDFGDLTASGNNVQTTCSATRGLIAGVGNTNTINYITIASTGNGADFGDIGGYDNAGYASTGCIGSDHGGLQ